MTGRIVLEPGPQADRLGGLRRFAAAITLLNLLGHTWFGFEQSIVAPFVGVGTAYAVELLLEALNARSEGRRPRYRGGLRGFIDFLLPAHISGLACAMLLYSNERLGPVAFSAAAAIASKTLFRVRSGPRSVHVMNPSNFGVAATLLLFPWVGIAPPYQFTANLSGIGDWALPGLIVCTGTFLNARFTRRLPLIAAWTAAFAGQAVIRSTLTGSPLAAGLMPMTGVAFLLYTFYMITDPATTPVSCRGQVGFGVAVAAAYGLLAWSHTVFGLYFALTAVTAARGLLLAASRMVRAETAAPVRAEAPARTLLAGANAGLGT